MTHRALALALLLPGFALAQEKPAFIEASGIVVPAAQIDLASPGDGIMDTLNVSEGDRVKAGDSLGNLNLAAAQVELTRRKLIADKYAGTYAAAKRLLRDELMSKDEFDRAEIEFLTSQADRDLAAIRFDERFIKAPFEGYVLRLHKKTGEAVQRLETVAKLVSISTLNVIIYLDADKIAKVSVGQSAEAVIDGTGGRVVKGTVNTVDPVVDPGSGLFRAKIAVENPGERVRSGPRATVRLLLSDVATTTAAP